MHHARKCRLLNSGPWSTPIAPGTPRSTMIPSSTPSPSDWRNSCLLPAPGTPAYTHRPHSAPGSPARTPPHRAQNPAPTPDSPPSAPAAAVLRVRSVFASFAAGSDPPLDTPDAPVYDSLLLPPATAARATADIRSAASPVLTPPSALVTRHRTVSSDSGNSIPPSSAARKPGARSPRRSHAASPRPPAGLRAPPVFCDHRLQHLFVQTQIHHQLFQAGVLVPQLLRLLRLAHVHPAVLRLPGIDRVFRHPHLPRHILRFPARFQWFERPDHLRLGVIAPRHELPLPQ